MRISKVRPNLNTKSFGTNLADGECKTVLWEILNERQFDYTPKVTDPLVSMENSIENWWSIHILCRELDTTEEAEQIVSAIAVSNQMECEINTSLPHAICRWTNINFSKFVWRASVNRRDASLRMLCTVLKSGIPLIAVCRTILFSCLFTAGF